MLQCFNIIASYLNGSVEIDWKNVYSKPSYGEELEVVVLSLFIERRQYINTRHKLLLYVNLVQDEHWDNDLCLSFSHIQLGYRAALILFQQFKGFVLTEPNLSFHFQLKTYPRYSFHNLLSRTFYLSQKINFI